jgi:hypothetical protein
LNREFQNSFYDEPCGLSFSACLRFNFAKCVGIEYSIRLDSRARLLKTATKKRGCQKNTRAFSYLGRKELALRRAIVRATEERVSRTCGVTAEAGPHGW